MNYSLYYDIFVSDSQQQPHHPYTENAPLIPPNETILMVQNEYPLVRDTFSYYDYAPQQQQRDMPIAQNKKLKQKITALAILFTYAVLLAEYLINPHTLYRINGKTIIMPPCIVIEPYVGYNIFLFGLPLATFMHLKLSLYQYHRKYGFLVFMEFIMATIIVSYDKIRKVHNADTLLLLVTTFLIILDFTDRKNKHWAISYFLVFIAITITMTVYDYIEKPKQDDYNNAHSIIYLLVFVLWVAFQWPLCTEYTMPPNGYEFYLAPLVFASGITIVALSNMYPHWEYFAKNDSRPWHS
jgi:FtsH-binding integral membrane protein